MSSLCQGKALYKNYIHDILLILDIYIAVPPEKPRDLGVTNIQSSSVLLQFRPGFNGHTSISLWIVEGQLVTEDEDWDVVYQESNPDTDALTVQGLRPYTSYRLRLVAENIAGRSLASTPTDWFETIQAPPSHPPADVTVRGLNETAIRVGWTVSFLAF